MALTGTEAALKTAIKDEIDSVFAANGITINGVADNVWDSLAQAIANAVISHLTGAAGVGAVAAHPSGGAANLV